MGSLIFAGYLRQHTDTYEHIWMSMVTYGFSDIRKLLMVAYRYIRTHTDEYGHLWI